MSETMLVRPPEFTETGLIVFDLIEPISAPEMKVDPDALADVLREVKDMMVKLGVSQQSHVLSFRPDGDSFVLYRVSSTVPGTVSLRHTSNWRGKRKR